jgi:hypothetical protein
VAHSIVLFNGSENLFAQLEAARDACTDGALDLTMAVRFQATPFLVLTMAAINFIFTHDTQASHEIKPILHPNSRRHRHSRNPRNTSVKFFRHVLEDFRDFEVHLIVSH